MLKELIEKYIELPSTANSTGWFVVKCMCCNDYKKRGGFLFNDTSVSYNCFNCQTKAISNNISISEYMVKILKDFNIPDEEFKRFKLQALSKPTTATTTNSTQITVKELQLPPHFYKLKVDCGDVWSDIALEYLQYERCITDNANYFLSAGNKTASEKKWYGRLIIPYYKQGKLIFYQGRDLTGTKKQRYMNSEASGTVLHNYDELYRKTTDPLFVVEGYFDAYHLNAVAIQGNNLSEDKIKEINQTKRRKIYIPDKFGNGIKPALIAIDQGWDVSTPDIGSCKDVNAAIKKYGTLYVKRSILASTHSGFKAKIHAKTWCAP
jgi:hypothetical protein